MIPALPVLLALAPAAAAAAEERAVMTGGFDRIRVEGPYVVTVATAPPAATITGDTRAIDGVSVRVVGTTLVVSPGNAAWGGYPGAPRTLPTIRVTVPELRGVTLNGNGRVQVARLAGQRIAVALTGAGSIAVADVRGDRLDATLAGTGRLELAGSVLAARVQANGAGAVRAERLAVRDLTVTSQGSSDLALAATGTATITADGQGGIAVAGTPACTVRGNAATVTCGRPSR